MSRSGGFFFSSRRRHTRFDCDWSSDVCSSDLGERDAREYLHTVYEDSLAALLGQLQTDLGRKDIGVVIGRLSDCAKNEGWTRSEERRVGKERRGGEWPDQ